MSQKIKIKLQPDERLLHDQFWWMEIPLLTMFLSLSRKKILKIHWNRLNKQPNLKESLKELKNKWFEWIMNLSRNKPRNLKKQIEDAKACDGLASTILTTNVSKEILEYNKNRKSWIWNHTETEIVIWQPKKKSADSQYWMEDDILF